MLSGVRGENAAVLVGALGFALLLTAAATPAPLLVGHTAAAGVVHLRQGQRQRPSVPLRMPKDSPAPEMKRFAAAMLSDSVGLLTLSSSADTALATCMSWHSA